MTTSRPHKEMMLRMLVVFVDLWITAEKAFDALQSHLLLAYNEDQDNARSFSRWQRGKRFLSTKVMERSTSARRDIGFRLILSDGDDSEGIKSESENHPTFSIDTCA